MLFAEILSAALAKTSAGTTIRYRSDGHFFDLRRLKANTKVQEALVRDFLFLQTIMHWPLTPKRTCNAWLTVSLLLPRPSA